MKKLLLTTLTSLLLGGCLQLSSQEHPVSVHIESMSDSAAAQLAQQEAPSAPAGQLSEVPGAGSGTDYISQAVAEMATQLEKGFDQNNIKRLPVAVIPFVNLMQTSESGPMGERLADSFVYQLQQRGYNLVDYRAVSLVTTTKEPLSRRNLSGLRQQFKIYFVLTGTYAQHPDGVVFNARLLDTTTRQVLASGQTHVSNARLEGDLPGYDPLQAQQKGLIVENGPGYSAQ
ncbi:FlgO family outer membrane protein [Neptuniibacter sp. CAU 1671]|uniref:FlgO family outer membrane protein n=1 Tax=Neptuniibacter sp. CAU 1671 TaxID=3032593 RepID=UPI0023DBB20F|nr:FlgO family outer membrane protein [Neptuniibacter sp. CAU 1671]MDF2181759.1 FlgO family outer membrane protein [Neptuniibacter sp. CAU 1671]